MTYQTEVERFATLAARAGDADRAPLEEIQRELLVRAIQALETLSSNDTASVGPEAVHAALTNFRRDLLALSDAKSELGPNGTISGTLTSTTTGAPIPNAQIELWGPYTTYAAVDATGAWSKSVEPGTWRASTEVASEWAAEAWLDRHCYSSYPCPQEGDAIEVAPGATVSGIDIQLERAAMIRGVVVDHLGAPLRHVSVAVFGDPSFSTSTQTDHTGSYELRVPPGSWRIRAEMWGFATEAWPDSICTPTCSPDAGSPITVTEAQEVEGIDFALARLGSIAGRVIRQSDGEPVAMVSVGAHAEGVSAGSQTDEAGEFVIASLPTGSYRVSAFFPGLQTVVYPGIACTPPCGYFSCDLNVGGDLVAVAPESQTVIEIPMPNLATLSGTVRNQLTGSVLGGVLLGGYGSEDGVACPMGGATSSADGTWEMPVFAVPHTLWAQDSPGYLGEVYLDRDCANPHCDLVAGDSVEPAVAGSIEGLDFTLRPSATLGGTVTEKATGSAPIDPSNTLTVEVHSAAGPPGLFRVPVQADGTWSIELWPGSWFARIGASVFGLHHNYRLMVWPDAQCPNSGPCPHTIGAEIPLSEGQVRDDIDFEVERLGRIVGLVSREDSTLPIAASAPSHWIGLFGPAGQLLGSLTQSLDDAWGLQRLVPGTYYLEVGESIWLQRELWDDLPCPGPCDPTSGTPIAVGIDPDPISLAITLVAQPGLRGTTRRALGGEPLPGALVHATHADSGVTTTVFAQDQGQFFLPLSPGPWRAWATNPGSAPSAWPGRPCAPTPEGCGSAGDVIQISTTPAGSVIELELGVEGAVFWDGFETGTAAHWSAAVP